MKRNAYQNTARAQARARARAIHREARILARVALVSFILSLIGVFAMLNPMDSKAAHRAQIEADTAAFLARGGKITVLAVGQSGEAEASRVRESVFTAEYQKRIAAGECHAVAVVAARRACGQDADDDDADVIDADDATYYPDGE